jgi:hypothetical protein
VEDQKHGADYRRQWRKVHLGIDAAPDIRAIEVNDNATGDAPMLPCLLEQIPTDETVASVSGDGPYDTKVKRSRNVGPRRLSQDCEKKPLCG